MRSSSAHQREIPLWHCKEGFRLLISPKQVKDSGGLEPLQQEGVWGGETIPSKAHRAPSKSIARVEEASNRLQFSLAAQHTAGIS